MDSGKYQKKFFESQVKYAQDNIHYQKTYSVKTIRQYIACLPPGKKILDAGCADGELLAGFVKKHQIYGIDNAVNLIRSARQKGLLTRICNLEDKIPFPEGHFDLVVAHHVIEHIVDTDRFLFQCNRVLKKGGTLFLTFPNTATFVSIILLLFNLPCYFGAGYQSLHVRDFTLKTINKAN